jgi:hypothetical protein
MSTAIKIADAVVAALQAGKLSLPFTAERVFVVPEALAYYDTTRVIVVPIALDREIVSRVQDRKNYTIAIGIRKRLGAAADMDAEMIEVITLAEEITDYLRGLELKQMPEATCMGFSVVLFDPEAMQQTRIATSGINVDYAIGG